MAIASNRGLILGPVECTYTHEYIETLHIPYYLSTTGINTTISGPIIGRHSLAITVNFSTGQPPGALFTQTINNNNTKGIHIKVDYANRYFTATYHPPNWRFTSNDN